ncbi:hypothetical protein LCGC14_1650790 [marine sediment metagenome]|uniref:Glycosyltransferase 2-like domain-containing protein n=1 Tax=marine sediment metagenome TaxID=412755 RepID=A0A0F9HXL5_9ZZZZ
MPNGLMSIIILNWNRLELSKRTISRIIAITTMPHELILVDNCSADESGVRQYLDTIKGNEHTKKIIRLYNSKNLGVGGGRNSGLVVASGDYLVTIDDDIHVPAKWDVLMADACDKIPRLGITGVNVEPTKFRVREINGARVCPKDGNLGGGCLCLPRRVFKRVGYYNYFSTYGHEDAAMYYRLRYLKLLNMYIEPRGLHMDKDADKAYRKAKNNAHAKNSMQLCALSLYRRDMGKTGDAYVSFDPNFDPDDLKIFTSDLIMKERKDKQDDKD